MKMIYGLIFARIAFLFLLGEFVELMVGDVECRTLLGGRQDWHLNARVDALAHSNDAPT